MKIFFFALITFVVFCYQCESVELECEYEDSGSYFCSVQNDLLISSKDDREISSIRGQHLDGKNDSDVKLFRSFGKVVKFFPQSLTKFFKNIESVEMLRGGLEKVSKEDLKEFGGNLRVLRLWGNKIEKIGSDLFEFNPNLENINLNGNEIKQIGSGAFNGLEKLKNLMISGNSCTDWYDVAVDDRSEVLELIEKVEASCKDLSPTTIEPELAETTRSD